MTKFDTVVRNARVATAADVFECDIGICDGRVSALANELDAGAEEIDAAGAYVLPGGIDAHVHLDEPPFFGALLNDNFHSGTVAAAHGGTTSIISFAQQRKGKTLRSVIQDYHDKAAGNAVVDYAFHVILTDPNPQVLGQELPALIDDGYTSYKCFMAYDGALNDAQILNTLDIAKQHGALVMIHAENEHCIHHLCEEILRQGDTSLPHFPEMAPMAVEREATHRAITLSELKDTPILLVHVSAREAMDQIQWGQDRGLKIYAETCPQYLFLTDDVYRGDGWEAAKYICSPPPRDKANPDALWRGIANGIFQIISSDHNAFKFDSDGGKKIGGSVPHFRKVPPGVPGIEPRLALIFSEGVNEGRIDINTFVATTATNPAKIYGLYPRKGTIAVGSDADIVIWDATREMCLGTDVLHEDTDFTPYEGINVVGWPKTVLCRGRVVIRDEEFVGKRGAGEFLPCNRINLNPPRGSRRARG